MSGDDFSFEREGVDFPFYKSNPKLTRLNWILLLVSVLISLFQSLFYYPLISISPWLNWFCFLLPPLIILGICRSNLSLLFKKLTKKDIFLIFKLSILSIFIMGIIGIVCILFSFFVNVPPDNFTYLPATYGLLVKYLLGTVELVISLMFEELFKFVVFILVLALVYNLSGSRKVSIVCAAFVGMVIFGISHFIGDGGLIKLVSDILFRGFGSVFEFYAYIKTKNILVSYFIHLFFDLFLQTLALIP